MQTEFSLVQLANPLVRDADEILRSCVHCGFCLSSCPTYQLTGDELDSPRGRIYLIKDMLEGEKPASPTVAHHIDRCLSCLACQDVCPSNVDFMHLVDPARAYIERTHRRPLVERMVRKFLGYVLPRPGVLRSMLALALLARPFAFLLPGQLKLMVRMAGRTGHVAMPISDTKAEHADKRVALLDGCVQQVMGAAINDATRRVLARHGIEVVSAGDALCCGAINHHLGQEEQRWHG